MVKCYIWMTCWKQMTYYTNMLLIMNVSAVQIFEILNRIE